MSEGGDEDQGARKAARKGQGDGSWYARKAQELMKWKEAWRGEHPWAEPVLDPAGDGHDRVKCVPCSLARGSEVTMEARKATLDNHTRSSSVAGKQTRHEKAVEAWPRLKQQQQQQQAQQGALKQALQAAERQADKERRRQLIRLVSLLKKGRPVSDYVDSRDELEMLEVRAQPWAGLSLVQ